MARGIKLLFATQQGASRVDSNVMISCDRHVYLAYCMVEAGMYGTMTKKHWSFALTEGVELVAEMPMYRIQERDGHARYVPRVPENAIRGSFSALLLALETVQDQVVRKTGSPVNLAARVSGNAGDGAATVGRDRPAPVDRVEVAEQAASIPGLEVVTLQDGTSLAVEAWEMCDGISDGTLIDTRTVDPHCDEPEAPVKDAYDGFGIGLNADAQQ